MFSCCERDIDEDDSCGDNVDEDNELINDGVGQLENTESGNGNGNGNGKLGKVVRYH